MVDLLVNAPSMGETTKRAKLEIAKNYPEYEIQNIYKVDGKLFNIVLSLKKQNGNNEGNRRK